MMGDDLLQRIRAIVSEQLGVDSTEVTAESHILEDLGADSLDVVELVMAIEDEFDIEVPDAAVEILTTVGDVESYVSEQMA